MGERSDRRRARALASDKRVGRFARRRYREAYRAYLRHHWRWLAAGALVLVGFTSGVAALVHGPLLRGIILGGGITATGAALTHFVLVASGATPLMMGELAEQWTAGELRKLQRGGWRVINHLRFAYSDADHIAIGSAGVFVIETKWSGLYWKDRWAGDRVDDARRQAQHAADHVSKLAAYRELGLPKPKPLVVLWGEGAADLAGAASTSDVVCGSDLVDRLGRYGLINARLTVEQLDGAWVALGEEVLARDPIEMTIEPIPASVNELAMRFGSGVVSGILGFLGAAELLKASLPTLVWCAIVASGVLAAHPLRRWPAIRALVSGWQTGLVCALVLFAAAEGGQLIR